MAVNISRRSSYYPNFATAPWRLTEAETVDDVRLNLARIGVFFKNRTRQHTITQFDHAH